MKRCRCHSVGMLALKVLPFASGLDEVRLQTIPHEAHARLHCTTPNIVPVYAVGNDRGVLYYAMQMIAGRTLADVIDDVRSSRLSSPSHTGSVAPNTPPIVSNASVQRSGSKVARIVLNRSSTIQLRPHRCVLEPFLTCMVPLINRIDNATSSPWFGWFIRLPLRWIMHINTE